MSGQKWKRPFVLVQLKKKKKKHKPKMVFKADGFFFPKATITTSRIINRLGIKGGKKHYPSQNSSL